MKTTALLLCVCSIAYVSTPARACEPNYAQQDFVCSRSAGVTSVVAGHVIAVTLDSERGSPLEIEIDDDLGGGSALLGSIVQLRDFAAATRDEEVALGDRLVVTVVDDEQNPTYGVQSIDGVVYSEAEPMDEQFYADVLLTENASACADMMTANGHAVAETGFCCSQTGASPSLLALLLFTFLLSFGRLAARRQANA